MSAFVDKFGTGSWTAGNPRDYRAARRYINKDSATGAMWNIEPDQIERKLASGQASLIKNNTGFMVVLESELTDSERRHMARLN